METAMEVVFLVFLPMLMCALSLLQMILSLRKRDKELEAALAKGRMTEALHIRDLKKKVKELEEALEKEKQEKNPEN